MPHIMKSSIRTAGLVAGLLSAAFGIPTALAVPPGGTGSQTYPSAQALADDLFTHGHGCDLRPGRDSSNDSAVDARKGACNGAYAGLYIYADPAQRDAYVNAELARLQKESTQSAFLMGGNWVVNCFDSPKLCRAMRAAIGGTVLTAHPLG